MSTAGTSNRLASLDSSSYSNLASLDSSSYSNLASLDSSSYSNLASLDSSSYSNLPHRHTPNAHMSNSSVFIIVIKWQKL